MTTEEFEAQLLRDGYLEIKHRLVEAGAKDTQPHSHEFDTRLLVQEGEMTVVCGDQARTCRAGEILDVAAGVEHFERYAPARLRFIAGLRHRTAA